jgi:hypothetical protein
MFTKHGCRCAMLLRPDSATVLPEVSRIRVSGSLRLGRALFNRPIQASAYVKSPRATTQSPWQPDGGVIY